MVNDNASEVGIRFIQDILWRPVQPEPDQFLRQMLNWKRWGDFSTAIRYPLLPKILTFEVLRISRAWAYTSRQVAQWRENAP
jgi:hypothetical protein